MNATAAASAEDIRKIAADFTAKAEAALSPEMQKPFEDLAAMYSEMVDSIQAMDELWALRQDHSAE